jgi:hypothetical protein
LAYLTGSSARPRSIATPRIHATTLSHVSLVRFFAASSSSSFARAAAAAAVARAFAPSSPSSVWTTTATAPGDDRRDASDDGDGRNGDDGVVVVRIAVPAVVRPTIIILCSHSKHTKAPQSVQNYSPTHDDDTNAREMDGCQE